jgi:hypothetical protein
VDPNGGPGWINADTGGGTLEVPTSTGLFSLPQEPRRLVQGSIESERANNSSLPGKPARAGLPISTNVAQAFYAGLTDALPQGQRRRASIFQAQPENPDRNQDEFSLKSSEVKCRGRIK